MSVGGTQQPGVWNESIYQGDSWAKTIETPWDLTEYTITLTIYGTAGAVLLTLSTPSSGITVGGAGIVDVYPTITAAQSALLPVGTWDWAWVFIDGYGYTRTYIVGSLTVADRKTA